MRFFSSPCFFQSGAASLNLRYKPGIAFSPLNPSDPTNFKVNVVNIKCSNTNFFRSKPGENYSVSQFEIIQVLSMNMVKKEEWQKQKNVAMRKYPHNVPAFSVAECFIVLIVILLGKSNNNACNPISINTHYLLDVFLSNNLIIFLLVVFHSVHQVLADFPVCYWWYLIIWQSI